MENIITEEKRKIMEDNVNQAKVSISQKIDKINYGLYFLGVYAKINSNNKNQLDFYKLNGRYIGSKLMGHTKECAMQDLGKYPYATFIEEYSRQIYSFDVRNAGRCEGYSFSTNSLYESGKGFRLEMNYDLSTNCLDNIEIKSYHPEDDFISKEFEIGKDEIRAEVDNIHGGAGDFDNGIAREIWYRGSNASLGNLIAMSERSSGYGRDYNAIHSGVCERKIDSENYSTGIIPKFELDRISLNIARHPRNKELISYVLGEYEKMIPGITGFIINNFSIYTQIMNRDYVRDELTDNMIKETINKKCNIESVQDVKKRDLKRN